MNFAPRRDHAIEQELDRKHDHCGCCNLTLVVGAILTNHKLCAVSFFLFWSHDAYK